MPPTLVPLQPRPSILGQETAFSFKELLELQLLKTDGLIFFCVGGNCVKGACAICVNGIYV
jgi:hypothetical protein